MKVIYIFRNKGYSIEKVFAPILDVMKRQGNEVFIEKVRDKRNVLFTIIYNMRYFAKLSRRNICHITGDVQYVGCFMNPKTTILTIHDLVSLRNPNVPWYSRFLCYWLWFYFPLKHLKYVTCISEATRQDLLKSFPWVEKKVVVIHNPISDSIKCSPKKLCLDFPRILHIGTKVNKNLNNVIIALNGIPCHLRIVGKLTDENKDLLEKCHINYSNKCNLSDEDIYNEYVLSDIVSFPSLFEGFGMPIIEAQAVGRPVVTSNVEPMKSVAGNNYMCVSPYEIESIRDGFVKIASDSSFAESLIRLGLENVKRYSSEYISSKYMQLYNLVES